MAEVSDFHQQIDIRNLVDFMMNVSFEIVGRFFQPAMNIIQHPLLHQKPDERAQQAKRGAQDQRIPGGQAESDRTGVERHYGTRMT